MHVQYSNSQDVKLSTSTLANGIYLVRLTNNDGVYFKKVIVCH
ncbi:MAG: T9SS type A sorting domain-containing protein [Bacteroidetes bacterium]|nr:T9SS type A sorting domain-containing protein [Bacteroidota bacterium]